MTPPLQDGFLILGQGLAGTCLGLELERRGLPFRILDNNHASSSSVVAAGLCNPVTGRRLALTPEWNEAMAAARETYAGSPEWNAVGQTRLFSDPGMAELAAKRAGEPSHARFLGRILPAGAIPRLEDSHGTVEIHDTHFLQVRTWLARHRKRWREAGILAGGAWDDSRAAALPAGLTVVCCRGWKAAFSPWWDFLPFEPARGDLLTLRDDGRPVPQRLLNGNTWLLPVGDGLWRAGATYSWDRLEAPPDPAQVPHLQSRFPWQPARGWKIVAHECGVRPILRDRTPVVGSHPAIPNLFVLNGLGSKGSLLAPLAASRLAAHLAEGDSLPRAWLPSRFSFAGK